MKQIHGSLLAVLCALMAYQTTSHAATSITSDGTLPTNTTVTFDGSVTYDIDGGTIIGANQFHSFGDFSIVAGDTASFNGPAGTANIISRVTGGAISDIDGTVGSTIAGANLFLINPAGVLIGPNAQLSVDGSVHISTADYLKLSDGSLFSADPSGTNNFTMAPPAAFGFLSATPAAIDVYTASFDVFQVAPGETLSFVGGDLTMGTADGNFPAFMMAPGGTINMISVASTGEAVIEADTSISTDNFGQLGNILLQGNSIIDAKNVYVRAGQFVIDDALILPGAMSLFGIPGAAAPDGGIIDIDVANEFIITGTGTSPYFPPSSPQRPGLAVFSGDFATGAAPAADVPDILVNAGSVLIEGTGIIEVARAGAGGAGSVTINADTTVELLNGGTISAANAYDGAGTPITISAEDVTLDGSGSSEVTRIAASAIFHPAYLTASIDPALTTATGGTITINASNNLVVRNAQIAAEGQSYGGSSDITLTAKNALFDSTGTVFETTGGTSGLTRTVISTQSSFAGDSGNINLTVAETLDIINGAVVSASTLGSGESGDLNVNAGEINILGQASGLASQTTPFVTEQLDAYAQLLYGDPAATYNDLLGDFGLPADADFFVVLNILSGCCGGLAAGITDFIVGDGGNINVTTSNLTISGQDAAIDSSTGWDGNAGNIAINVDNLIVSDGAAISSRSGVTRIDTGELFVGAGNGGNVSIIASNSVTLQNDGSISASSLGTGLAGDISLDAGNTLDMHDSSITTQATVSDGGNINVMAIKRIYLDHSEITTSVESGTGTGGNINIDPEFVILQQSNILANAFGGSGGNINIIADNFLASPDSLVQASSALGLDGTINISSPDEDVSKDLETLPDNYLDVSSLLSERCGTAAGASSLVNAGPDGLSVDPDSYLPSFVATNNNEEENGENKSAGNGNHSWAPYTQQTGLQLAEMTCTF